MIRFRALCIAALIAASGPALADDASHAAAAEQFLKLAHADKLTTPVYAQVQQMFAQRFAQSQAPDSKKAVLQTYQAKADAALDNAVGWDKLKPDMVKLYTDNFSEQELKDLIDFYQSPLGTKVMQKMPTLTAQSAQLAQAKLQSAVPQVNQLMEDMSKELGTPKATDSKAKSSSTKK
jgi:hypothetical protein